MQKIKKFTLAAVSVSAAFLLAACGNSNSQASNGKTSLNLMETDVVSSLDT
ncbi:peptide ABC transporter substrate-binding protein, partial [Lactobacillus delbrueckii subsp. bulgaricus]